MKVYLLDVYGRGTRYFLDEKSIISYLKNDSKNREPIHRYKVTVLEAEFEMSTDGGKFLETYRERNLREGKSNAVLGDEYAIAVEKFIGYIKENATDNFLRKDFLKATEMIPVEKKEFSKFIANYADYLLYQVSDTVEYYKLLFAVHNFRKINDKFTRCIYDKNGRIHSYTGGVTSETHKQNFLLAKIKK